MQNTSRSSARPPSTSRATRLRHGVGVALAAAVVVLGAACSSTEEPGAGSTSTTAAAGSGGDAVGGTTSTTAPAAGGDGTSTTAVTVAEHGPLPTLDLDESEQAYVDALMSQETPEGMDDEQAECIASHWIDAVGVDAVTAAGVTADGIAAGTASVSDIPVDRATAEKVVDSYEACEFDIVDVVVTGFSSMVQGDPTKLACVEGVVTPEFAREYMVAALMASETGAPDLEAIQQQLEPCLS